MQKISYLKILNCKTSGEVYRKVRAILKLHSDHEHLVRSSILDLHLMIEIRLKKILFQQLKPIMFFTSDKKNNVKIEEELWEQVSKKSFMDVFRLLEPCLKSFPADDFLNISGVNRLRNDCAHKDLKIIKYKNGNPFNDDEIFAQLFLESQGIVMSLDKFLEKMIEEPRFIEKELRKRYKEKTGEDFP